KRMSIPGGINIEMVYDKVYLTAGHALEEPEDDIETVLDVPGCARLDDKTVLHARIVECCPSIDRIKGECGPELQYLDAEKTTFPLILRRWREGDRFTPLGMSSPKKVHDYFVDAKVPRAERIRATLLCSGEDIMWIVGHRCDDRFKLTSRTGKVIAIAVKEEHD
ncbi:tRNA lysidine(34) synthetase TilS, partial [Candidatus Hydrogenedentota bacterium]